MSLFSFFSRTQSEPFPFHELGDDVHSHLMPGVDDGSPDETVTASLAKGLVDLGFRSFTATPHVMEDIWKNNRTTILEGGTRLNNALTEHGLLQPVRIAAEYLVDGNFEQLLKNKEPLLTIQKNWVLIEISFVQPPLRFRDILFDMQLQGYQPVFAHPERYHHYHLRRKELQELHDAGCILQSNLLSFTGYYGPQVLQMAEWMASQGMIGLLGTDLHHERHLQALQEMKFTRALQQVMSGYKGLNQ